MNRARRLLRCMSPLVAQKPMRATCLQLAESDPAPLVQTPLAHYLVTRPKKHYCKRTAQCNSPQHASEADRIASRMRSGLSGSRLGSTLKGESASATALAMATGGAIAPPSPTPLTPSGLSGEGEWRWMSAMAGISHAVGMM